MHLDKGRRIKILGKLWIAQINQSNYWKRKIVHSLIADFLEWVSFDTTTKKKQIDLGFPYFVVYIGFGMNIETTYITLSFACMA